MRKRWLIFALGVVGLSAANADDQKPAAPEPTTPIESANKFCSEDPGPSLATFLVPANVAGEVKITFWPNPHNAQDLKGDVKIWIAETLVDMQWSHCARNNKAASWTVPIRPMNVERQLDLYVSQFPTPNHPGSVGCKVLPVDDPPLHRDFSFTLRCDVPDGAPPEYQIDLATVKVDLVRGMAKSNASVSAAVRDRPALLDVAQAVHQDLGGFGKEGHDDSIAADLLKCFRDGQHGGNVGSAACYEEAYKQYDDVLNVTYKYALGSANESTREAINNTQRKWISFRDAEDATASNYNTKSKGAVTPLAIWDKKIASIRQRISELAMYAGFDEQ